VSGTWQPAYSGDDFDYAQSVAQRLTDADRLRGRPAPAYGYSAERFEEAKRLVHARDVDAIEAAVWSASSR
jgi:hypothetical protein